jgi:hypothetical protein
VEVNLFTCLKNSIPLLEKQHSGNVKNLKKNKLKTFLDENHATLL